MPHGKWSAAGEIFWLRLTTASAQCLHLLWARCPSCHPITSSVKTLEEWSSEWLALRDTQYLVIGKHGSLGLCHCYYCCFILKIHQNTTNISYSVDVSVSIRDLHQLKVSDRDRNVQNTTNISCFGDVSVSIRDLHQLKVSDRDRNVNEVRTIGCVLMNFYYETFTNQMFLFTDTTATAVGKSTAVQQLPSESLGRCVWRWCTVHVGHEQEISAVSFWRRCRRSLCTVHGTCVLTVQSDAAGVRWPRQSHRLLWHSRQQVSKC